MAGHLAKGLKPHRQAQHRGIPCCVRAESAAHGPRERLGATTRPICPKNQPTKGTRHVLEGATCVSASRTGARVDKHATTTCSARLTGRCISS